VPSKCPSTVIIYNELMEELYLVIDARDEDFQNYSASFH
jgi:hypothetical protein